MLLGGSGDALLMKLLRHTAKQKGLTLNEYGCGDKVRPRRRCGSARILTPVCHALQYDKADENPNGFLPGTLRIVNSEREIFELLAMPYLDPAQREYSTWRAIYAKAGACLTAAILRIGHDLTRLLGQASTFLTLTSCDLLIYGRDIVYRYSCNRNQADFIVFCFSACSTILRSTAMP